MQKYNFDINYKNKVYPCIAQRLFYCLTKVYDVKTAEVHYLKYKKEFDLIIKKFNAHYNLPDDGQGLRWFNDLLAVSNKFSHPLDISLLFSPVLEEYVVSKVKTHKFNLGKLVKIVHKLGVNIQVTNKTGDILLPAKNNDKMILTELFLAEDEFVVGENCQVKLPVVQQQFYQKLKMQQALLYEVYVENSSTYESKLKGKIAGYIVEMMYKHHSERCGVAGFKTNILLAQQRVLKEHHFLHRLRIVKARLERHKEEYIQVGMSAEHFATLYTAIDSMIEVMVGNIYILEGIENSVEVLAEKESFTAIKQAFSQEKLSIENKMRTFLAAEHTQELEGKLIKAVEACCLGEVLSATIKSHDQLWADRSKEQYSDIEVEDVLLPRVCKHTVTHIVDYYELCEDLKEHGFDLELDLLQKAVLTCDRAYSKKLHYLDKINLDLDMVELMKQVKEPFYDRDKHNEFKQRRDKVLKDILIYIRNHYKELNRENFKELGKIICNLLVQDEVAKYRLNELFFLRGNFFNTIFHALRENSSDFLTKESAIGLEAGIKTEIAKELGLQDNLKLGYRAAKKVLKTLAKKELGKNNDSING